MSHQIEKKVLLAINKDNIQLSVNSANSGEVNEKLKQILI